MRAHGGTHEALRAHAMARVEPGPGCAMAPEESIPPAPGTPVSPLHRQCRYTGLTAAK
jgi:hypothetical protein